MDTAASLTTAPSRRPRLRCSDCSRAGLTRVKRGRGFSYLDADGRSLKDPEEILRLKGLAIPPAWQEVWICPDPLGHLQATGVDAAGRKQYLYHPRWRELQDRRKFDHMIDFAHALPRLRKRVLKELAGEMLDEQRVLACAIRLLGVGMFRIGSEQYADEEGGVGLATVDKAHVKISGDEVVFDYLAKSGVHRVQAVQDPISCEVVAALKRRRGGGPQLLAYREGRRWHRVRSEEINDLSQGAHGRGLQRQGLPHLEFDVGAPRYGRRVTQDIGHTPDGAVDGPLARPGRPSTQPAGEGGARPPARRSPLPGGRAVCRSPGGLKPGQKLLAASGRRAACDRNPGVCDSGGRLWR
jgi:hypothetical protein